MRDKRGLDTISAATTGLVQMTTALIDCAQFEAQLIRQIASKEKLRNTNDQGIAEMLALSNEMDSPELAMRSQSQVTRDSRE